MNYKKLNNILYKISGIALALKVHGRMFCRFLVIYFFYSQCFAQQADLPVPAQETEYQQNFLQKTSIFTQIEGSVVHAPCYGVAGGSIQYTIQGGKQPYYYTWSNGVSGIVNDSCFFWTSIENSGAPLSDYQVRINVGHEEGMKNDFSNVRFSDTSGVNLYNYWIERVQTGVSAVFWVKVPTIPNGLSYLKVSYCEPGASSLSNGYATFDYFEDFDNGDISAWSGECRNNAETGETCNMGISNTFSVSPENSLRLYGNASCGTENKDGIISVAQKVIQLPEGDYRADVTTRLYACLYSNCSDTATSTARMYYGGEYLVGYYVRSEGGCGCIYSRSFQMRSTIFTSTGQPENFEMHSVLTDCTREGAWMDNFRIRKAAPESPVVTVGVPLPLVLPGLTAGSYVISVADADGDVSEVTFKIDQPDPPSAEDKGRCGEGMVVLSASGPYSSFRWYDAPESGTLLQEDSDYITEKISSDQKYYVSGVGSDCETYPRQEVKALIYPYPATPQSSDTSRCGPGSVLLKAEGALQYGWYEEFSEFAQPISTENTFQTPEISDSAVFYVTAISDDGCESDPVAVNVYVDDFPSGQLYGSDTLLPGVESDDIYLLADQGNIVQWEKADQFPFTGFQAINTLGDTIPGKIHENTTYYRVKLGSGSCPAIYTNTVAVVVNTPHNCISDTIFVNPDIAFNSSISVLENEINTDQDVLLVKESNELSTIRGGIFDINAKGYFNYQPPSDFLGIDSIAYTVCDQFSPDVQHCFSCNIYLVSSDADNIVIYSVITPNGDMLNDEWIIEGIERYPENTVIIFDRWGNIVFESEGYDNLPESVWRGNTNVGTAGEADLPPGTYFYMLDLGNGKKKTGYVMLKR